MSKLRMFFVGILAVFALGAVASASASAAECTALAKAGCLEVLKNLTSEVAITGAKEAGTGSELEVEGIGKIECTAAATSATLDETETAGITVLPFTITFTGCALNGHANCEVLTTGGATTGTTATESIEGSLTAKEGTSGDVNFKPTGASFAKVEVAGATCLQAAKIVVTGTQLCLLLLMEKEETSHLLECTTAGSNLKNGAKLAKFSLTEVITTTSAAKASLERF